MPSQSISEQYQNASNPLNNPRRNIWRLIASASTLAGRMPPILHSIRTLARRERHWAFNGEKMVLKQAHKAATPPPNPQELFAGTRGTPLRRSGYGATRTLRGKWRITS